MGMEYRIEFISLSHWVTVVSPNHSPRPDSDAGCHTSLSLSTTILTFYQDHPKYVLRLPCPLKAHDLGPLLFTSIHPLRPRLGDGFLDALSVSSFPSMPSQSCPSHLGKM